MALAYRLSTLASGLWARSLVSRLAKVMDEFQRVEPLLLCPNCASEMRLFGIEPENERRDLYTFECSECGHRETRGVVK